MFFFFSSRRRHTRCGRDWSSDVCSSDLFLRLTNPAQERLAHELTGLAPEGFTRVRFVTGGAEANEMAIQLARRYHVDRGEPRRWQVISPAQAYHGPTMATLALTGRPGLQRPFQPYMPCHLHIPPSTWPFDPTGQQGLDALDP